MNVTDPLLALAACPHCRRTALKARDGALHCGHCATRYPLIGGIPWLFREPTLVLGEWQNRLRLYVEEFRLEERCVRAELVASAHRPATERRLQRLADAYAGQVDAVLGLLEPLGLVPVPAPHAVTAGLGSRVPRQQDLHSYYVNLHRDWVWGDAENAAAVAAVSAVCPRDARARALVLGAGGCRLAYDLHGQEFFASTIAVDLNPLLLLSARALLDGESVELYEFPIAPRSNDECAVRQRLRAPSRSRPGLELVFADALDAPFADAGFDVVLTPWLIDILDDEFDAFVARMNRLVRPGGCWVNFGSVSFASRRPSGRLGIEEVREQVAEGGFVIEASDQRDVPYMRSPHSRHSRLEGVWSFRARKVHGAPPAGRAAVLPAWLRDPMVAVPLDEQMSATAVASRLQAFVLTLIDGRRFTADLARFVVEQQLLGPEAALAAVRGLLQRLHEARRQRPL